MARELKIRITGDSSGLRSATDDSVGILEGFSSKVSALSVAAGNLLADGIRQGFGAISGFAKGSIGAASDLNETVSKVGVLFGAAAPEIEAFAATAAASLGQSKQQAMDAAATFATFGKSAGLGGSDLAKFSTDLTSLSSDMASFSNTTPQDAIDAIGAALRGESEPIRRYGVLLDDASMRQKALELGIISSTKNALTPQQKVLAAQALILDQTSAAQGDFARTSDGLANKSRILKAQMSNLQTTIGQAFLPVVLAATTAISTKLLPVLEKWAPLIATEIVGGFRAFVSAFKAFDGDVTSAGFPGVMERIGYFARLAWEAFQDFLPTLQAFADVVAGGLQAGLRLIADNMDTIRSVVEDIGPPLAAAVTAFLAFNKLQGAVTAIGSLVGVLKGLGAFLLANPIALAVAAIAGAFVLAYKHSEAFRNVVDPLVQRLVGFVKTVKAAFERGGLGEAFGVALEGIKGALSDLGVWLVTDGLPWLREKASQLARALGNWLLDAAGYLRENLPGWLGTLTEWLVGTALPWLIIQGSKLALALADWVGEAGVELLKKLPGWLLDFGVWLVTDALPAVNRFGADIATEIVDGLIRGLGQMASKLYDYTLKFIRENIPEPIRKILDIDSPSKVAMGLGEQVARGLALGMTGATGLVATAADGLAMAAQPSLSPMQVGLGLGTFAPAELPGGGGGWNAAPIVVETYLDGRVIATSLAPHQRALERSKR